MAENLNYADSLKSPYLKKNNWCYNRDSTNCLKGGRFYSWTAAMDIDSKWQNVSPYGVEGLIKKPHQGVCPKGWHIPTNEEWSALFKNVGYAAQQSVGHPLWKNATNASGFSALPIGDNQNFYVKLGINANFGSTSERNDSYVYYWLLSESSGSLSSSMSSTTGKSIGIAVRCFQD